MNESKKNDPRMWMKWNDAGAIGSFPDSYLPKGGLRVRATARYQSGPTQGNTLLAMERNQDTSQGWSKEGIVVYVKVPGFSYKPGQVFNNRFPGGTEILSKR
jgi:hypothetical protein